jgi:hypothetical protein
MGDHPETGNHGAGAQTVESIPANPSPDQLKAKEAEAGGLELGSCESNPSIDILPGGRLPGSTDDTRFVTTRKELWSYYFYYVGNNGR